MRSGADTADAIQASQPVRWVADLSLALCPRFDLSSYYWRL